MAAVASMLVSLGVGAVPAFAAPAAVVPMAAGSPGIPGEPTVLYEEDFENDLADGEVVPLVDYVGATGATYSAEGQWANPSNCNGFVLDGTSSNGDMAELGCTSGPAALRGLATSLGAFNETATPAQNHVVAAYTAGDPGADLVEFETESPVELDTSVAGRFLSLSANVAAVNCNLPGDPRLNFYLLDAEGNETPVSSGPTEVCDIPGHVGQAAANSSVLFDGDSVGIRIRNAAGSGWGNDHAFDDIRVLDVTPQLDKEFPETAVTGRAFPLTFTATNTSELAGKSGWSFADTLSGLRVADDPNIGGTCDADVEAAGSTITVTDGVLAAGEASCTITVDVIADAAGEYSNGPGNIDDAVGIDLPGEATVLINDPISLFAPCEQLTFDEGDEGWRAATTSNGTTVNSGPVAVGWEADAGNPGGALAEDDLDGNWTELWTPDFIEGGYASDYSDSVGQNLSFDYRNTTGISVDVYVGLVGTDGSHYWYNFRDQVTDPTSWTRVIVPLDAAEWQTGFDNGSGPVGAAPSAEDFLAALSDVERFAFSIEGQAGADRTYFDNFGQSCELSIEKTSTATADTRVGDVVEYTVTATNVGAGDYTDANPAVVFDDLSGVLDDATYNDDAAAEISDGSDAAAPAFASPLLSWSGALASGESVEITYSATVTGEGDDALSNVAWGDPPDPDEPVTPNCVDGVDPDTGVPCGAVTTPLAAVAVAKTSDPESGTSVQAGDTIAYTLTFTNDGAATGTVDFTDHLGGVLDDAELTGDLVVSPAGALTATVGDDAIAVTGSLAVGDTVTVTYEATVLPDGERGDNAIGNLVAWSDDIEPECGVNGAVCTDNPVGEISPTKSVNPASGTRVATDSTLTYTLAFENIGTGTAELDYVDHLARVLDDADLVGGITATNGAMAERSGDRILVTGEVAPGETATVTYTVRVKPAGQQGDRTLANFLVPDGETPPTSCAPDSTLCTTNPVAPLATTGSEAPLAAGLLGLLALLIGGGLALARRRRATA
ncbi:hypothetical protein [Microbacterium sp.]|uniref:DUF7927 domain-containing protein n=1 Tax=Microbacterium sp. TaxID=51671 RepID=UPI0039E227FE